MKKLIPYLFILAYSVVLPSCTDDPAKDDPLPAAVNIEISSPAEFGTFHLGDTVFVKAKVSYPEEMHGYALSIINSSNGDEEVFSAHYHEHGSVYMLNYFWVNDVSNHSDMLLRITAYADHEAPETKKEIHFHCHPM